MQELESENDSISLVWHTPTMVQEVRMIFMIYREDAEGGYAIVDVERENQSSLPEEERWIARPGETFPLDKSHSVKFNRFSGNEVMIIQVIDRP